MGATSAKAQTAVLVLAVAGVAFAVARAPVWHDVVEEERAAYHGPSVVRQAARAVEAVAKEVERYRQGQGSGVGGVSGPANTSSGFADGVGLQALRKVTSTIGYLSGD